MARKKKSDDPDQQDNAENNDDTFGLPEIEYEPLRREETSTTTTETTGDQSSYSQETQRTTYERQEGQNEYAAYDDDDDSGSAWPKILGILALLLLAGAAYWFFAKYQPAQRAALKARQEQAAKDEAARLEKERAENARLAQEAADKRRADSLANITTTQGEIQTLTERTRRYYVVVASAIDGDLIMDEARKLSSKGVNPKIIPPFGTTKFYRLAVADGDTYKDTQATADGMKGEYGDKVWVIRY